MVYISTLGVVFTRNSAENSLWWRVSSSGDLLFLRCGFYFSLSWCRLLWCGDVVFYGWADRFIGDSHEVS